MCGFNSPGLMMMVCNRQTYRLMWRQCQFQDFLCFIWNHWFPLRLKNSLFIQTVIIWGYAHSATVSASDLSAHRFLLTYWINIIDRSWYWPEAFANLFRKRLFYTDRHFSFKGQHNIPVLTNLCKDRDFGGILLIPHPHSNQKTYLGIYQTVVILQHCNLMFGTRFGKIP